MATTIQANFETSPVIVEADFQITTTGTVVEGGVDNLTDSTLTLTGADDEAGNYTRSTLTHDAGGDLTIATEAGGTGVAGDVVIPKKLILGGTGISYPLTFLSAADPSYTMEVRCDGNGDLTFTPDTGASGVVIRHNLILDVFGGYQYSARNGSNYSMRLVSNAEDVVRLSDDSRISWSSTSHAFGARDTSLSRIGPGIVGVGNNSSSTDASGSIQCATVNFVGADDGAGNYTRGTISHDAGGDLTIATEAGGTGVAGDVIAKGNSLIVDGGTPGTISFRSASAGGAYEFLNSNTNSLSLRFNGSPIFAARGDSHGYFDFNQPIRFGYPTVGTASLYKIADGHIGLGDNNADTPNGNLSCATVRYSADTFVTESTTARTLSDADWGKVILCTNASGCTVTVPSGLSPYFFVIIKNKAAGTVDLDDDSGATTLETALAATEAAEHEQLTVANLGTTDTYEVQ